MICPLNFKCDEVIYSEYSKFFGIPVELLGMFYYGAVALGYSLISASAYNPPIIVFAGFSISVAAFLFSLYLTFIQAFNLRQWCSWCLMSAGLSAIIFISLMAGSEFNLVSFLIEYRSLFAIAHILGMALGLGGATIVDILFFKFLKDFRISEWEADVMRALSEIIWFALSVVVLAGFFLYFPEADALNQSPKFLAKMLVVLAIIINGAFLNLFISPKLVEISFREEHDRAPGGLRRIRKLAFALGAVSLVSWYSAFILGMIREIAAGFSAIISVYLIAVLIGVVISQLAERSFAKRATNN